MPRISVSPEVTGGYGQRLRAARGLDSNLALSVSMTEIDCLAPGSPVCSLLNTLPIWESWGLGVQFPGTQGNLTLGRVYK